MAEATTYFLASHSAVGPIVISERSPDNDIGQLKKVKGAASQAKSNGKEQKSARLARCHPGNGRF
jgi:hypothetical protein